MTVSTRLGLAALVAMGLGLATSGTAARQAAPESSRATAVFAGGCFWCLEQAFDEVDGVVETISGYGGGQLANPTYEQVSSGRTGHTEVVQVTYDPSKVSYVKLLEAFWVNVDAVDGGGQFCDRGSQYRSVVFVASDEEQRLADASQQQAAARLGQPIKTEIVKAGPFYRAEEYHQDYYTKNPVRYKFYKWNCGRAQRLEALWGKTSKE